MELENLWTVSLHALEDMAITQKNNIHVTIA